LCRLIVAKIELVGWSVMVEDRMSRYRTQIKEVISRNIVISLALEQGFNAFLPVYDGGMDFILYHEEKNIVRKVQLKGRWMIDKKYIGRDIWIAFPIKYDWYLMPHDKMLEFAEAAGTTKTSSWIGGGAYSQPAPSKKTIADCAPYRFPATEQVQNDAIASDVK
jgi:hypothetical protein